MVKCRYCGKQKEIFEFRSEHNNKRKNKKACDHCIMKNDWIKVHSITIVLEDKLFIYLTKFSKDQTIEEFIMTILYKSIK